MSYIISAFHTHLFHHIIISSCHISYHHIIISYVMYHIIISHTFFSLSCIISSFHITYHHFIYHIIITHLAGQTYVWHGCKWNFARPQVYLQPTKIKSQYFGVSLTFLVCIPLQRRVSFVIESIAYEN